MSEAAVLFIIFNRPISTKKVFDAIRLSQPSRLYIAADAPRAGNEKDVPNSRAARKITEKIDWPCEVKRLYQTSNLGCSKGPIAAFNWFFSFENEGIILEDDCLPSKSFFPFCTQMLETFRYNTEIMLISGCNLGYNLKSEYSYTFSKIPNMWGWATWKRSAEMIDYELTEWVTVKHKLYYLYTKFRQSYLDADLNWYRYWRDKFDKTVNEPAISWWDWQWIYFQTKDNKFSIIPSKNLITNIGFNSSATHTKEPDNPAANLANYEMEFPIKHPKKIKGDNLYEEQILKWNLFYHKRLPWHFHVRHTIKKALMSLMSKKPDNIPK